jgi:hypothetical protein
MGDVQKVNTDDMTDIRIELPLPMDITGTLLKIIGLTWPGAVIKQEKNSRDWDRHLVVGIPNAQRHKTPKAAEKYVKRKEYLNANADAAITGLDPSGVSFGWPEWLARSWVAMAMDCWEKFPDAKNYLESTIHNPESREWYVFYVAKSEGQTPHALREAAEKRLQVVRDICEKRAMDDWLRDELLAAVGPA